MRGGLLDFLRKSPAGLRVSALAFTDLAVPLTALPSADHLEVEAKIRRLDHRFMTRHGTNLVEALGAGAALFDAVDDHRGGRVFALVLISDGDVSITPALDAELSRVPYRVHAIGVGSAEPVYIPDPGAPSGYLEVAGEPVQTVLREDTLRFIASRTGGDYYPFRRRGELLEQLGRIIERQGRRVVRTVVRERSVALMFFAGAFLLLALHQLTPGWRS